MEVRLIKGPRTNPVDIDIQTGITIEELIKDYNEELPYTIIAAKVNNKIEALTYRLKRPAEIELLDMRNQAANLIYQYSLSLIYLKAINDVLGKVRVEIKNSLNKGLFTNIKTFKPITNEDIKKVQARMREIVNEDIPFIKHVVDKDTALDQLLSDAQREKIKMLQKAGDVKRVKFYSLEDTCDFFYGMMVPSTRYIEYFELRKYKAGVLLRFPHQKNPDQIPVYVDEKKLYEAFAEETRWSNLMEVRYVNDLNEKIVSGEYKELIQLSEAVHEKKIAEIANLILKENKRIILIAGPSSSGKTTFARRLCIQLKVNGMKPLYLGTDDYYLERVDTPLDEYGEKNFEDLEAIDIKLFNNQLNDLLEGKTVDIPEFDFFAGMKVFGKRLTKIYANQPIVIEGIHGLNKELTAYLPDEEKFKIYISPFTQLNVDEHNRIPTTDARMLRRIVRDSQFRGYSAKDTIKLWPKVRTGEDKNIFPFSNEADVLFNSSHIYELAVLKKYAEPLLLEIKPEEPEYSEAIRMLKFIGFFDRIENDSIIVNNSIIREFIGGSIFV
ncbi:MAG: nucleoside kinase [Peptostreptococcaceae bacterium]|nr:nucleoside kinase [Peptostreptococcaceae bacterium]